MIKYNTNPRTTISILFIVLVLAISASTTNELKAQIPPKTALYPIGVNQTPGGPRVKDYDPAVLSDVFNPIHREKYGKYIDAIGEGNENVPPLNAISCQFPPMLETSNSTAMVVYKKEELGFSVPMTIHKMRFSALYFESPMDLNNDIGLLFFSPPDPWGYPWGYQTNKSAYLPFNVDYALKGATMERGIMGLYFDANPIADPTPVEIWIKNGAEFTERGNQTMDKTFPASHGWVKVYDGFYDYSDTTQWDQFTPFDPVPVTSYPRIIANGNKDSITEAVVWEIDNMNGAAGRVAKTYGAKMDTETKGFNVTIPFAQAFKYTGGDITVAFVNPGERRGIKTDIWPIQFFSHNPATGDMVYYDAYNAGDWPNPTNPIKIESPSTYRFRCYSVYDEDVNNVYLGPKFQIGSQINPVFQWHDWENNTTVAEQWVDYGLSLSYWEPWISWHTLKNPDTLKAWSSDTNPTENVQPWNSYALTYNLPMSRPFQHENTVSGGSVKPKIGIDIDIQSLVTTQFAAGANFKTSTQMIYLPGGSMITSNDTQHVIGEFTIYADSNNAKLSLKEIAFNLIGTDNNLGEITLAMWRDTSATGKGNITTSKLIDSWKITSNTEDTYLPLSSLNLKLNAGENRFFFVFNIDVDNAICQAPISMTLKHFMLGNREFIDTDKEYTLNLNTTAIRRLSLNPTYIANINNDKRQKQVCYNEGDPVPTVSFDAGRVIGINDGVEWYYSLDNKASWIKVTNTPIDATVLTLPALVDNKKVTNYTCRAIYNKACATDNDTVVWNLTYSTDIHSVDFIYEGKLPHDEVGILPPNIVKQGDFLEFKADAIFDNTVVPVYNWEISSDNGVTWTSIGSINILNYTIPSYIYGDQLIRVTAAPDPTLCACTTKVISDKTFKFYVQPTRIDFSFIENLPGYELLCPNDSITLNVSYNGTIDVNNSWWEKDGKQLYINGRLVTERTLKISNTGATTFGSYQYRAKAKIFDPSIQTEPGWQDVLTTACIIAEMPRLEIFYQPEPNNYAVPGLPVICLVETSYIDNGSLSGYQWYKHTDKGDIPLKDNDYRFGSTSNQLILVAPKNLDASNGLDVFTFNGEYYFLQITGACSTATTNHIYVLPSDELHLTEEPQNAIVCELGEKVTYTVKSNEGNGISNVRYQWYVNGTATNDVDGILGSQTPALTIDKISDINTEVYCEVLATLPGGIKTKVVSDTVGVEYSDIKDLIVTHSIDNTALTIDLQWETNNLKTSHSIDVYLNNNIWTTEELPQSDDISNTKTMNITIPVDDKFAQLLANDPATIDMTVKITNDCENTLTDNSTVSVEDLDIKAIPTPTDVDETYNTDAFDILPNPVNDVIIIGFFAESASNTAVELCDLSGQRINTLFNGLCQPGYNKLNFNLTQLNISTGTYLIRIKNDTNVKSKHFVFTK